MASRTSNICIDAHDPYSQTLWWADVLEDFTIDPADELLPGDEVERILGLGATMADDRREGPERGWAVLADPEGNEFCVLRRLAVDA